MDELTLISLLIERKANAELKRLAQKKGVSKATLIRQAVAEYLRKDNK